MFGEVEVEEGAVARVPEGGELGLERVNELPDNVGLSLLDIFSSSLKRTKRWLDVVRE